MISPHIPFAATLVLTHIISRNDRLLAHAGFDPRRAVQFWEDRSDEANAECGPTANPVSTADKAAQKKVKKESWSMAMKLTSSDHPMNEVRVKELRAELRRWQEEREKMVAANERARREATEP